MGQWRITIEGTGCHHNGKPEIDADLAAKEFVDKLRAQGHNLTKADFTLIGGKFTPDEKHVRRVEESQDMLRQDRE